MANIVGIVVDFHQNQKDRAAATIAIEPYSSVPDRLYASGDIEIHGQLVATPDGRVGFRYGNSPGDVFFMGDEIILKF